MATHLLAAREEHRDALRAAGKDPYPPWNEPRIPAGEIVRRYQELEGTKVTVAGRTGVLRSHGGIGFLDLQDASGRIQLLLKKDSLGSAPFLLLDAIDPGDILAARGIVARTAKGEISVEAQSWTLLTKALASPPEKRQGLKDAEERARKREVDLLANEATRRTFAVRSKVLEGLRAFLTLHGFTEVETPILQELAGGAAARPFRTHHHALDLDLSLRIAPELYLKRLIVGGYEKVFELGRAFRNEGIDRQHNPEFTICELYQAYATVEDLIPLTEQLISKLLADIHGSPRILYQGQTLNFASPWPRVSFVEALKKATGVNVLEARGADAYLKALKRLKVAPPEDQTLPNLMDALMTEAVRKKTAGPLLITGAPAELEPLAKRDQKEPRLVQRIQLVVAGMELVKAYTEENDPVEQEQRFREQSRLRRSQGGKATSRGEAEVHPFDAEYLEALQVGLPPTAGWGMGVDRLVMLAADQPSIRDVLLFPLLRPKGRKPTHP